MMIRSDRKIERIGDTTFQKDLESLKQSTEDVRIQDTLQSVAAWLRMVENWRGSQLDHPGITSSRSNEGVGGISPGQ